jgi:3',5'-cyclic-AMP phosphodiesterase
MKRVLFALGLVACDPPSEQRAERDLEVGHATIAGVDVSVVDGLAAVRLLEPGHIALWCSAPEPVLEIRVGEPGTWLVELDNAMPGARLATARELPTARPTKKLFEVELGAGDNTLAIEAAAAADPPFRIAVMSDVQDGIDEVQDLFASMNAEPGLSFLLGAGDLSQNGTREELERFQRELESLAIPYYTTLGNHDATPDTPWHELYGRGNFRFVFQGVQFSLVDSSSSTLDPMVYDWLDGWLAEGLSRTHVFAMHIPALDPVGVRNGAFGNRNEAGKLLSMLERGDVAMTLYGHIHSFYQFENAGMPAFISGGGGAFEERLDGYHRHYLVIDLGAAEGVIGSRRVDVGGG